MSCIKLEKRKIEEKLSALGYCGAGLVFYDSTDSTNLRARAWARTGGGAAVFVASSQSAGRGRLGRSFLSSEGGIYLSLLLYPERKLSSPSGITAEAAVRLCRAVERVTSISPQIKWVNDLYINGKKVAGILTEGEFDEKGNLRYYVVGMGINVYKIADFDRVMPIATTLEDNTNSEININDLCAEIIAEFSKDIPAREALSEYRERCFIIGSNVTVITGDGKYSAKALAVREDYTLEVSDEMGEVRILGSGEVSLKV